MKWNSAFARLAYSYVSIVLVIVLLLCSIFYIYFSRSYKEELQTKNQMIVENTARTIENSVLERVQKIYVDLSLDRGADLRAWADASVPMYSSSLLDLQQRLKAEAASNADIVHAVHVYNPQRNVMLSSLYGLIYNANDREIADFFADWMNGMLQPGHSSSLWTPSRWIPDDMFSGLPGEHGHSIITYAHRSPFPSPGENSDLIVAIDVKESAIHDIIQNMMPSHYEYTFIGDRSGHKVIGADLGFMNLYSDARPDMAHDHAGSGSFSGTIDHTSYIVSYQALPAAGWMMYSAVPASLFYEQSLVVNKLILGISLLAIVIGLLLSGLMAKASYSPIKRLVEMIKSLSGQQPGQPMNDYKLIDTAFTRLHDKVSTLEDALEESSPIIKRNVVLNILRNHVPDAELADKLSLLGLSRTYSHYGCLLLNSGQTFAPLSSGNMQMIMSRMIQQLESIRLPGAHIVAEELPDKKIVVMLCSDHISDGLQDELSQLVLSEGRQQFRLDLQLSWGSWVNSMGDLHHSYIEAETLMKYAYFLPEQAVLKDRRLLEREDCVDEIPQSTLLRFKEKLYARQPQAIAAAVDDLIGIMRDGAYPADYCHFILANTVFVFSDYLKSVRFKHPAQGPMDLYKQYIEVQNIDEFRQWLLDTVNTCIALTEKRNSERALSTLELAKEYIENHLSEDLSLETVSSKVFISAKYLSRLFKEELGMTYTDYITSQRMERAKTLIESNHMSIEQVAASVGYGTAAYFIKKFKEMYGCTPGNYLRNMAKQV
ncbi:AraC family transcriptional regulator [Paenibacillus cisolokensis]|uniref:AraC family transcriptional regulator n=1 Tax=Paenibacillus cisolokensis TaxID=1658519 RepID=UPI003D2B4426